MKNKVITNKKLSEKELERDLHSDLIVWDNLSVNKSIFKYNYKYITHNFNPIKEKLIQKCFNPKNLSKFKDWGFDFE